MWVADRSAGQMCNDLLEVKATSDKIRVPAPLPSRLPKRPSLFPSLPPTPISGQQRLQTRDFDKNSIAEFTHLSLSPAIHRRKLTRQKQFGRRTTESTTSSRDEDDFTSGERREGDQEGGPEEKHSGRRIQSSSS